jgi:tRNA (Thr-GGU) A37 N-methylase
MYRRAVQAAHRLPVQPDRRHARARRPIGVTLVRVVGTQGSTVTVIGLDALDGSPILDVKPSQAVFDAPPVEPGAQER